MLLLSSQAFLRLGGLYTFGRIAWIVLKADLSALTKKEGGNDETVKEYAV